LSGAFGPAWAAGLGETGLGWASEPTPLPVMKRGYAELLRPRSERSGLLDRFLTRRDGSDAPLQY
jgi:hypothetical protein